MLIPSDFYNSVVSIEAPSDENEFRCIATGFLCGFIVGKDKKGQDLYKIFLVTNRHVFRGQKLVYLRFNTSDSSKRYPLPLINKMGEEIWSSHPQPAVDLGVVPIAANKLKDDGIDYSFVPEQHIALTDTIRKEGIFPGDGVYVLGFPMGIAGNLRNYVIVRGGTIARIDDEIIEVEHGFLIDAMVFPGNSGGPVFLKPEIASIQGTKAVNNAYLLGVVKSYIPYTETAYSLQSGVPRPKVEFSENSGLAFVVPMDYVKEVVTALLPKKKSELKKKEMSTEDNAVKEEDKK